MILEKINTILEELRIPSFVGAFPKEAHDAYCVIIPQNEQTVNADDLPDLRTESAYIYLFAKGNYSRIAKKIKNKVLEAGLYLASSEFIEFDTETKVNTYRLDVEIFSEWEEK